ncbi:MAG TPA: MaoC family dehydratase N-terminal domain-containing protein [Ktedonobacterales bacterium]|jgi:acyl dehydratase
MSIDASIVGAESPAQTVEITADAIRQFADAVGDDTPIFHDEAAARAAGHPALVAPPTFVTRFRQFVGALPIDPIKMRLLHGEEEYTYTRPLYAGDTLTIQTRVAEVRQRPGKDGTMTFVTLETTGKDASGAHVYTGRTLAILRIPEEGA